VVLLSQSSSQKAKWRAISASKCRCARGPSRRHQVIGYRRSGGEIPRWGRDSGKIWSALLGSPSFVEVLKYLLLAGVSTGVSTGVPTGVSAGVVRLGG
jgi:hypothetical protein